MKHEGSGLGVMEYCRVVAASNEKNYLKKRVQFTEEKPFEIEKMLGQQMLQNSLKKLILI